MRRTASLFVLLTMLLLGGCATNQRSDMLTITLNAYANAIRWGDIEGAMEFIDPPLRTAHPVSKAYLERYKQIRVSEYDDGNGPLPIGSDEIKQVVHISFVDNSTQSERSVIDHQVWRYDADKKHWWLTTGLPDIGQN